MAKETPTLEERLEVFGYVVHSELGVKDEIVVRMLRPHFGTGEEVTDYLILTKLYVDDPPILRKRFASYVGKQGLDRAFKENPNYYQRVRLSKELIAEVKEALTQRRHYRIHPDDIKLPED